MKERAEGLPTPFRRKGVGSPSGGTLPVGLRWQQILDSGHAAYFDDAMPS
jgi:hypothetical protein